MTKHIQLEGEKVASKKVVDPNCPKGTAKETVVGVNKEETAHKQKA